MGNAHGAGPPDFAFGGGNAGEARVPGDTQELVGLSVGAVRLRGCML